MGRIIFVDGGSNHRLSERNPEYRNIGIGWGCIIDADDVRLFWIPEKTCNEMELIAIILALRKLDDERVQNATILSDSKIAVNASDPNRIRTKKADKNAPHLTPLAAEAKSLVDKTKTTINWVSREENEAGKLLDDFEKMGRQEIKKRFKKLDFKTKGYSYKSLPIFERS